MAVGVKGVLDTDCYQFDANLFINYLLNEDDSAKEVRKRIERSNPGNSYIIISTNEAGEISKRLLSEHLKGGLKEEINKRIKKLSNLLGTNRIRIIRFQDVIRNKEDNKTFFDTLGFLNDELGFDDSRVQESDRFHLCFFALTEAKRYYTSDSKILQSQKIVDHFKDNFEKEIKELS